MCACALVVHSCACVFGMAPSSVPAWVAYELLWCIVAACAFGLGKPSHFHTPERFSTSMSRNLRRSGRFVKTPPPILILEGHALAGCYIYTGCAGLTLGGLQSSSTTPAMLELSHMKVSPSTASFFGALMQHCPHALLLVELHSSGCLKP